MLLRELNFATVEDECQPGGKQWEHVDRERVGAERPPEGQ